jgi:Protein of unknown function DUF262
MAQSYLRNPSIERLPTILEELHTGSLCIPPFQRDFEWTGQQRLDLCGSVRLGLPTGSLMVWRTSHKLAAENPIGPYLLDPPQGTAPQYLLDGRQRMTTLYAALAAGFWTRNGKEPPKSYPSAVTSPDGTPWSIMFNLEFEHFLFEPRTDDTAGQYFLSLPKTILLPLAVLLDDTAYDDWRSKKTLSRELANRARALRSAFMDYLIPVVPLATDDIGVVTLTFKRVNNGGTPMSDADMARALAWGPEFDLRNHIDAVREKLTPVGWGDVEDDALLKVVAVVAKLDPTVVDPEQLAGEMKKQPALVASAGDLVVGAADFLVGKLGISGPGSLPYTQLLVFVARALHEAGGSLTVPQQGKLAAWVAEVCIDERFGGAPPHMIQADWRAVANRLDLPNADAPRARDEKLAFAKECWRFGMNWARSRGTALVLADQGPKDGNDQVIPNPCALIARSRDGIGMLVAEGAQGLPASLLKRLSRKKFSGAALRSPANRVVCPSKQLPELRNVLFQGNCPQTILQSHLIDDDAYAALIADDLNAFFEHRRKAILNAEKQWVKARGGKVKLSLEPRTYAEG